MDTHADRHDVTQQPSAFGTFGQPLLRVAHFSELQREPHAHRKLAALCKRERVLRLLPGYYACKESWQTLDDSARHLALARAVARQRPTWQFSHRTAALAHGLAVLGQPPAKVDCVIANDNSSHSTAAVRKHLIGQDAQGVTRSGLNITSVARTILDLSCAESLESGLACADNALHSGLVRLEDLSALVASNPQRKNIRVARVVTQLASGQVESVSESMCRAKFHKLHFVQPELQQEFRDNQGLIGRGDFYWREQRTLMEFDGKVKYTDEEMLHGRTMSDVIIAEKHREDRIRRLGIHVLRVTWDEVMNEATFASILSRAGIPEC